MKIEDINCEDCKHWEKIIGQSGYYDMRFGNMRTREEIGLCNKIKQGIAGSNLISFFDFGCKFFEPIDYVPNADDKDWKLKEGEITIDKRA